MDTFPYHQPFIPTPSVTAIPHPSAGGPPGSSSFQQEDHSHNPRDDRKPNRRKGAGVKLSTDPQSVAARERRHRISDRFKILQSLVPGGSKMDTVSMLEEAIHYVKFLKAQIWLHQALMANQEESSPPPPPPPPPLPPFAPPLALIPPPSFVSFPSLEDGYNAIAAAASPLDLPTDHHQQSFDNYSLPPLPGPELWSFQPDNEMPYSSQLPSPIDYYQ